MQIIARSDLKTVILKSIEDAIRFFDDCTYTRVHHAIEHGAPLFKDNEKFYLDEEIEYEPERDG